MGRRLKNLPKKRRMSDVLRLRGINNRNWGVLWLEGLKTAKGRKAWRNIQEIDALINKYMSRI